MGIFIVAILWLVLLYFTIRIFSEDRKKIKNPDYNSPILETLTEGFSSKTHFPKMSIPRRPSRQPKPEFIENHKSRKKFSKTAKDDNSKPGSRVYKFSDLNLVTQAIYLKYNVLVFSDQLRDFDGKILPASPDIKIINEDLNKPVYEIGTLAVVYNDSDVFEDVILYSRGKELPVSSKYLKIYKKCFEENGFFKISEDIN